MSSVKRKIKSEAVWSQMYEQKRKDELKYYSRVFFRCGVILLCAQIGVFFNFGFVLSIVSETTFQQLNWNVKPAADIQVRKPDMYVANC